MLSAKPSQTRCSTQPAGRLYTGKSIWTDLIDMLLTNLWTLVDLPFRKFYLVPIFGRKFVLLERELFEFNRECVLFWPSQ